MALPSTTELDGVKLETIAALDPDVILGTQAWLLNDESFPNLSKIAPIATFAEEGDISALSWQERLRIIGIALGMSGEVEDYIDNYDTLTQSVRDENRAFEGKTITWVQIYEDAAYVYSVPGTGGGILLTELGFNLPSLEEQGSLGELGNVESFELSLENLDSLNADVLVIAYGSVELQETFENNPLLRSTRAVQAGSYVSFVDTEQLTYGLGFPTPLSAKYVVGKIESMLQPVVK